LSSRRRPEPSPDKKVHLDLTKIRVYFATTSPLGDEVLNHVNDPLLPTTIRDALQRFNLQRHLEIVSFSKALETNEDFILISLTIPENVVPDEDLGPRGPPAYMALHGRAPPIRLADFVEDCLGLFHSVEQWSRKNGLEINLLQEGHLSADFEKRVVPPKRIKPQ